MKKLTIAAVLIISTGLLTSSVIWPAAKREYGIAKFRKAGLDTKYLEDWCPGFSANGKAMCMAAYETLEKFSAPS